MSFARWSRRFCLKRRGKGSKTLTLGIDPGSRCCGYGIIETEGASFRYVSSGTIALSRGKPLHERLRELHEGLMEVISEFRPSEAVVEKVFFAKSARSALSLGHARGIALVAAASSGLDVHEYSALEVKKAITGYGRAEKSQVQEMVKKLLGIGASLSPDGADALGLALCHINTRSYKRAVAGR